MEGERPPADQMHNEIFLDKKCGLGQNHDKLYKWCAEPTREHVNVECSKLGGMVGSCDAEIWFNYNTSRSFEYLYYQNNKGANDTKPTNGSSTTTTTTPRPDTGENPKWLHWKLTCPFGPTKNTIFSGQFRLQPDVSEKIVSFCRQEYYGVPGWPLWLILLIIFLIIVSLTVAGSLFWKYWLRRKVYGPQPGEPMSTLGSQWTSAPISSVSGISHSGSESSGRKRGSSVVRRSSVPSVPAGSVHSTPKASSFKPISQASTVRGSNSRLYSQGASSRKFSKSKGLY